jgi:hypothetical protein
MKNFTQKFIGLLALVFAMSFNISAQDCVESVRHAISAGLNHNVVITSDGTLNAYGSNNLNQLDIPTNTTEVVGIHSGEDVSFAVKSDGSVTGWGYCGNYPTIHVVPEDAVDVVKMSVGLHHALALKSDGTVVGWGDNNWDYEKSSQDLTNVVDIEAAFYGFSFALKADGTVVGWQGGAGPNLGITELPNDLTDVVDVEAGGHFGLALKADGTVVGWGDNGAGQLNIPEGLSDVIAISAGYLHAIALKSNGTVVSWGGLAQSGSVPEGLTDVIAISCNIYHNIALKADGSIVAWGGQWSSDGGRVDVPEDFIAITNECSAEVATQNIPLNLPQGWSMFGYTCLESLNVVDAFSDISYNIEIVKDEWGLSYLPSWDFNAMGSLQFSEGYQIKMIEEVTDFQFCTTITLGASQEELDAAYDNGVASVDITSDNADVAAEAYSEGAASVTPEDGISQADLDALAESYAGWCESDIDNDGICDVDEISGCMDASSCNYVSAAEFDDSSCEYTSCLDDCGVINGDNSSCSDECGVPNGDNSTCTDECGVPNGDNSTCLDCAGVVNGTSEDLGCGCGNPGEQAGYDCDGNEIVSLQIGDQHAGGIVFQINEDGTGLVADLQDLGNMDWYDAMDAAANATSQGYDDWSLPSLEELSLMYNTIGNGGPEGNIGSFINMVYWSSSEYSSLSAWLVVFDVVDTYSYYYSKSTTYRVRVIRAF